jgi:Ni,Fe-hydrogenase I cytochrome b subunit
MMSQELTKAGFFWGRVYLHASFPFVLFMATVKALEAQTLLFLFFVCLLFSTYKLFFHHVVNSHVFLLQFKVWSFRGFCVKIGRISSPQML